MKPESSFVRTSLLTEVLQSGIDCVSLYNDDIDVPGGVLLESKEFVRLRKKLNKTQAQMAQLLGTSIKAIHSYEQGWRRVPAHAERQLYFLAARKGDHKGQKPCWVIKECPSEQKRECPAWEFQAGRLCWFINGTICDGTVHKDWQEKIEICRSCEVFNSIF